jgi:O-antigen ligase
VLLLASLVILDLAIVGSWFGVDKLAQRIEQTTMQDVQEREDPAAFTLPLIKDYPIFGAGAGSFYITFPRYRQEKVREFFDYATMITRRSPRKSASWASVSWAGRYDIARRGFARTVGSSRLTNARHVLRLHHGCHAILIHSWVDFNLQIPANAVLFMVLLALGGSRYTSNDIMDEEDPRHRRRRIHRLPRLRKLIERGDRVVGLDNFNAITTSR